MTQPQNLSPSDPSRSGGMGPFAIWFSVVLVFTAILIWVTDCYCSMKEQESGREYTKAVQAAYPRSAE